MDRLFIAAPLSERARGELTGRLNAALPGGLPGRIVPPESWHLTLRFLGDTSPDAAAALVRSLRADLRSGPFHLTFGALGAFPRPARASVLWLGISRGAAELAELARAAESAARDAGFSAERRPFTPHLTLSRLRPAEDVRPVLERARPIEVGMEVGEVVLFRSVLGGGPARYEAVDHFPLG